MKCPSCDGIGSIPRPGSPPGDGTTNLCTLCLGKGDYVHSTASLQQRQAAKLHNKLLVRRTAARYAAFFLAACLVSPASAQTVSLPPEVKGDPATIVVVKAVTDCTALRWVVMDTGLSMIPPELLKDSRSVVVMSGRPGRYRLLAYGALKDAVSDPAICTVVIGDPTPIPTPTPTPDPTPDPTPGPDAAKGLRVLMVYETAELSKLAKEKLAVLNGGTMRDWLNSHCAMGPDGKTREWRVWDKDVDASNESKTWQSIFARPKQSVPWVSVTNGTKRFEGPLPETVEAMISLLSKYAKE